MGLSQPHEDLSTEELFRRFAPFVARFLFRLGVRSDGLDDVVQDVFLVVHRRGGYKAGPAKPTSYLATIATNAASAYRRTQHAQRTRLSDMEVEKLVSTNTGPVQVLEATERLRVLQAALDRLEPDFRSTLILADIEGETCASIAASMGVPTGTVYWRLHEARKRFQRALRAEEAGVPARAIAADGRHGTGSEPRERSSLLALALNPLWFLSDARRLLRAGALQPPVHYDVLAGLERHRQLSTSMALPSWAPSAIFASAAGHSAGIGVLGLGGAGLGGAVALALGLFFYLKPHPSADDRGPAPAFAPPAPTATPAATASSETAFAAHGEPSARTDLSAHAIEDDARDVRGSNTPSPSHELVRAPALVPSSSTAPSPDTSIHTGNRPTPKPAPGNTPVAQPTPSNTPVAQPTPGNTSVAQPTPVPAPAGTSPTANDSRVEALEIARAERMLSSNPAGALAIVRSARARFKPSFLPEERDYIEVMALRALGRTDEATAAASRFLGSYPGGAFANRVRGAIGR